MASPPPLNPYVATHFSIDVECVATGTTHHDRAIAQIALVALEQEECRSVATPPATT